MNWFFHRIRMWFRRQKECLSALFAYALFLKEHHHDWDFGFFLHLMRFKLNRMKKHFETHAYSSSWWRNVQEINLAIMVLDRIIAEDYSGDLWHQEYLYEQDLDFLNRIFKKYLRGWWD